MAALLSEATFFPPTLTQASQADKPRGDPAPVTELVEDEKAERRDEEQAKGHGVHVGSDSPAQHSSPRSVLLEEESSCLPQLPTATQTSSQATPAHADDCNVSLKPVQPSAATAPGYVLRSETSLVLYVLYCAGVVGGDRLQFFALASFRMQARPPIRICS